MRVRRIFEEAQPVNTCHPITGYDPREDGAMCDKCILGPNSKLFKAGRIWAPVKDEIRHVEGDPTSASVMVVAQCPADKETEVGLPAQGPAGMELTDELEAAGM